MPVKYSSFNEIAPQRMIEKTPIKIMVITLFFLIKKR
jgi:hypothetical protein